MQSANHFLGGELGLQISLHTVDQSVHSKRHSPGKVQGDKVGYSWIGRKALKINQIDSKRANIDQP